MSYRKQGRNYKKMSRLKKGLLIGVSVLLSMMLIGGCIRKNESSNRQGNDKLLIQEDDGQEVLIFSNITEGNKVSDSSQEESKQTEILEEFLEKYIPKVLDENGLLDMAETSFSYVGKVGDKPIHMTLDFYKAQGSYSYDHIGKPIDLDVQVLSGPNRGVKLYEEEGRMYLFNYSANTISGYWRPNRVEEGNTPFYEVILHKEGTKEEIVLPKSPELKAFEGKWYGETNTYFRETTIWIYPINETLIYYEGSLFDGQREGSWAGFATQNDELGERVYEDRCEEDYDGTPIYFNWHLEGERLKVDTETLDWNCGANASFDASYIRENLAGGRPTAMEVGITANEEEEALFKKLVQDYYDYCIDSTSSVHYEEKWLNDTEKALGGFSHLKGWSNACYYMKSKNKMYVAIRGEKMDYFTNDPDYQSQMPKSMAEWAAQFNREIEYHYIP